MTEQQLQEASRLWKEGMSLSNIIAIVGTTTGSIKHHTRSNRILFPERENPWLRVRRSKSAYRNDVNTMTWVTFAGAVVTLPKVSILETQA